ncbi:hypothetical protein BpHYR1_034144 [Brachionus plicatilis]|uniref:Uncharacterized protein n=1 Tax=Brachionus plicatilis TaxID=10195 RepID=A0A3M7S6E7_BRAPC|nr:hypothetical protein BpHYR1_034144 [Brachionus plicatilis]
MNGSNDFAKHQMPTSLKIVAIFQVNTITYLSTLDRLDAIKQIVGIEQIGGCLNKVSEKNVF